MKIKAMYFFEKNKLKISLFTLLLLFVLIIIFVYNIIFKIEGNEEIVFLEKEDNEILKEEEQVISKYYVDIKGEVKTPGVYLLEENKRVIDVIEKAGGLTESADTSVNNLSRKIEDEMVIIIYSKEEVAEFATIKEEEEYLLNEIQKVEDIKENNALLKKEEIEASIKKNQSDKNPEKNKETLNDGKVSINTATKEELMRLSGIGSAKAEAIIAYRNENGSFSTLEELLNVNGIGEAIYNQIKDSIKL